MKYTPCLTWPRCGYPTQVCPLKHPQVDKLPTSRPRRQPTVAQGTEPIVPRPPTDIVRAPVFSKPAPDEASRYNMVPPAQASALVIPHDAVYASAVHYHNPMPPSAEMFSQPPRVAVRLSHPSDGTHNGGLVSPGISVAPQDFGVAGVHQGRGRRVSIAVQRLEAHVHGAEFVRGHGRGKVRHSAQTLSTVD